MAKCKIPLEEKYKDVPHYELIKKDGVVIIPSIFMFTGGQMEYYPFLKACSDFNCTVHLQNEGITIMPGEDDTVRRIKEMLYFQMAACPDMVEQYIRFALHKEEMVWEEAKGVHEPILKE